MPKKLSYEEIKHRLQEGRNYKRLYFELKVKYDDLKTKNIQLTAQMASMATRFEAIVEAQAARITELETMVFGRKPKLRSSGGKPPSSGSRTSASYRRPSPSESEVTGEERHDISGCHHCGGPLTDIEEHI